MSDPIPATTRIRCPRCRSPSPDTVEKVAQLITGTELPRILHESLKGRGPPYYVALDDARKLARAILSRFPQEGWPAATVYVVEEDEGRIWLSVNGVQASTPINGKMGQALQQLAANLPPPPSKAPDHG